MNGASQEIAWTWFGIRASGVTAWGLLSAVMIWGLLMRTRLFGSAAPARLLNMHRWLGSLALLFLAAHLGLLLIDPAVHFTVAQILVPGLAPWEPIAVAFGVLAMWFMLPVSALGRLRTKLGKHGATLFKRSHLIAYSAWPLATAHYVLAGTDALAEWSIALLIAVSAVMVFLLLVRGYVPPQRKARAPQPKEPENVPA